MAFVPRSEGPPVSVEDHVARILAAVRPLPPFDQPLLEAVGLPVCEDVVSPMDVPPFDNSAMDGYAVRAADVDGAAAASPVRLPVVGEAAAGGEGLLALAPGSAVKIMTGAPVPHGADAVVPVEWTDAGAAAVEISKAPSPGQHVRRRGDDVSSGDVLLEDGSLLGPRQVGVLAGVGRSLVRCRPRPRVVVISTGSELREPGTPLGAGSMYDANSFMLAAAARSAGAIAYRVGILSDDPDTFGDALSDQLVRADVVVTSGGVSKGQYDVVKEVLSELGTVWFGEVAMQPGKPQGFGHVGPDRTPIFTLPGNPVSSYVSFEMFVLPAIRTLMGRLPARRPAVRATITRGFASIPGKQQLVRARFEMGPGGNTVTPVGGHGSHLLGDLSKANALLVVPAEAASADTGASGDVLVLDRDF
jgi:molybdopterin molybdotransferase